MSNKLKIFALDCVKNESNLTKEQKLNIGKFIVESNDNDIWVFLFTGQMLNSSNNKLALDEAGGRIAKLRKTFSSRAGVSTPMIWALYRKIRSIYDGCTKRCGTYEMNTSRRQHCMIVCKIKKLTGEIVAARKEGNSEKVSKLTSQLQKSQNTLKKSIQSFKSRGAEIKN